MKFEIFFDFRNLLKQYFGYNAFDVLKTFDSITDFPLVQLTLASKMFSVWNFVHFTKRALLNMGWVFTISRCQYLCIKKSKNLQN